MKQAVNATAPWNECALSFKSVRTILQAIGFSAILMASVGTAEAVELLPLPPGHDAPLSEPIVVPSPPAVTATIPAPLGGGSSTVSTQQALATNASLPTTISGGRTPAAFSVGNSGAATYTIPIWAPPGVGSVQLNLALAYSSRSRDGIMGVGWNLTGMSAITRCNRTWAQDGYAQGITLTTSDRLCLDGQQLKVVTGTPATPAQGGTTFATEVESFSNITAAGSSGSAPTSLTVTTKNGLIYDYGLTVDSQILAGPSGPIRTWALSQIRDRVGNKIKFTYYNDAESGSGYTNGSYRIKEIDYPYTASGKGPFYSVTFTYGGRLSGANVPSGYIAGSLVKEPNQLNTISVQNYGPSTATKTYTLTYGENSVSSRLELQEVQECSASNCLPATMVGYQYGGQGWSGSVVSTGIESSTQASPIAIDLDGDGFTDLLYPVTVNSSTVHWWILFSAQNTRVDTGIVTSNFPVIITGAFSGTGQNQFLVGQSGYWYVYTCNPAGCTHANTNLSDGSAMFAADYDGDGLPDLVSAVGNSVLVRRNITQPGGAVTFASSPTTVWTTSSSGVTLAPGNNGIFYAADFNGDGRADILATTTVDTGFGIIVYSNVLLSNGFSAPATAVSPIRAEGLMPGDWNGDGCTDLISLGVVYISNCAGGFTTASTNLGVGGGVSTLAIDWDGDGNTDLLYDNNGIWYVARSTGTGMTAGMSTGLSAPTSTSWLPLDQNGDGLADLAYVDGNDSNKIKYVLHSGAGTPPDLARSFTDGFMMNQSPTYVPLSQHNYNKYSDAQFPEQDYQGPLYVVNQFTASDGTGSTYQNQFWYYGARVQAQGRGFEGIYVRRTYDTRNSLYTYDYTQRPFPWTGVLFNHTVYQSDNSTPIVSYEGTLASQVSGGSGYEQRTFPYLSEKDTYEYEYGGNLNGTFVRGVSTKYTYGDGYGNPTEALTTWTDADRTSPFYNLSWTSDVNTTYLNDAGAGCVGLPTHSTVNNSAPGQTSQTRTYSYTPDSNHAFCREQAQVIEPNTPALTVTTSLGFDSCGNVNSVAVTGHNPDGSTMAARTTSYDYGHFTGRCQLPESATSALGTYDTSTLSYNYNFGVPATFTDPNGVPTSWLQDDFGRERQETRADGTVSTFGYPACASPPCWAPSDLRFIVTRDDYDSAGKNFQNHNLYYDGFNRLRYDESYRVLGVWNTNELRGYDSLGRLTREYVPFSSGPYGNGFWSLGYDPLNRLTQASLYQSDGSTVDRTVGWLYQGRTATITDPLKNKTNQVTDVMGRLRQVKDPAPGGTTYYDFDAFGNLNNVKDTISAGSSATYNLRGFKTQIVDADAGTWNFHGDSLNELVSWSDAKTKPFSAVYDAVGRMTSRTEPEGTSTWNWGKTASAHDIGSLDSESGNGYSESLTYDSIGRLQYRVITTDQAYQYDYAYNSIGAIDTITYPTSPAPTGTTATRFKIQYGYSYGFPFQISDITQSTAATLWTLTGANDYSSPTGESLGASVVSINSTYTPWTNDLKTIQSGVSGSTTNRQNLSYTWDVDGNLYQRQDLLQNPNDTEVFSYDALNRLTSSTLNGNPNFSASYLNASGVDQAGNIMTRSDVGTYTYGDSHHPHAVTAAGSNSFTYDANGNVATRNGLQINWASYNLPTFLQATVGGSTYSSTFAYGPDHQRYQQSATYSNGSENTSYAGGLLEKVTGTDTGGIIFYRHFVPTPSGLTLIVSRNSDKSTSTTYVLSDHLGSSDAILSGSAGTAGNLLVQESFGAFGLRRGSNWSGSPTTANYNEIAATTRHGFTFHEELDNIGLIHMNGRVYDPSVGRFMSTDPLIGDLTDSQSVNPYAYVGNRPLSGADPSGLDPMLDPIVVEAGGPTNPVGIVATLADVVLDVGSLFGLFGAAAPPPPPASVSPNASAQSSIMSDPCAQGGVACGGGMSLLVSSTPITDPTGFPSQWLIDPDLFDVTVGQPFGDWTPKSGDNPNGPRYPDYRRAILGTAGLKALEYAPGYDLANCVYSAGGCGAGGWLLAAVTTGVPEGKAGVLGAKALGETVGKDAITAAENAVKSQLHHAWPKYLGGAAKQDLVPLSQSLHEAYHTGLDKILPRQWGAEYYQSLSQAARQQVLQDLATYTKAFDAKYGTQLYDALIRNGFPAP